MDRKFGIELEIVGINREAALRALHAVGINVQAEAYNHTTRGHWKFVSDASVRGGFEVVSPVLQGEAGIKEAMTVAEALSDAGATVNRSCGFHVHFDAADLSAADVKAIVHRYAAHEAEIDAFMPPSRRGGENSFCLPVSRFLTRRFDEARTMDELAAAQPGRYFKVNLQSFRRHGTLEFRQHSGTVNATKVANWVRFLGEFIDQCKRPAAPAPAAAPAVELPALSGVQARLAEMFAAQSTVSLAAMCERFNWQPHTARAAVTRLRRAGLRISPVRENGESAYRLEGGHASTASASERADSLWTGISERVIRFYQRRAAVLAVAA